MGTEFQFGVIKDFRDWTVVMVTRPCERARCHCTWCYVYRAHFIQGWISSLTSRALGAPGVPAGPGTHVPCPVSARCSLPGRTSRPPARHAHLNVYRAPAMGEPVTWVVGTQWWEKRRQTLCSWSFHSNEEREYSSEEASSVARPTVIGLRREATQRRGECVSGGERRSPAAGAGPPGRRHLQGGANDLSSTEGAAGPSQGLPGEPSAHGLVDTPCRR